MLAGLLDETDFALFCQCAESHQRSDSHRIDLIEAPSAVLVVLRMRQRSTYQDRDSPTPLKFTPLRIACGDPKREGANRKDAVVFQEDGGFFGGTLGCGEGSGGEIGGSIDSAIGVVEQAETKLETEDVAHTSVDLFLTYFAAFDKFLEVQGIAMSLHIHFHLGIDTE